MRKSTALLVVALTALPATLRADGSCYSGDAAVTRVQRLGEVVGKAERVYFLEEPKACPAKGPCPWRRKAYIVLHDRVEEEAVSGAFSCVTYTRYQLVAKPVYEAVGSTTGWVPSEAICIHPPLRKSRSEPKPALDVPGRVACSPFTRTVEDDEAFYGGVYRSGTATLTVTDATDAEMTVDLKVDRGSCHIRSSGTAYVSRPSVVSIDIPREPADPGPCLATAVFDDEGVHLDVYSCKKPGCEDLPKDELLWQKPSAIR
jgi:hypothetical protein